MRLIKKSHRKLKTILIVLSVLIATGFIGFFAYTSDYYRADKIALAAMQDGSQIEVRDHLTILSPSNPSGVGLIFYPGGKVEHTAYLPLLQRLQQKGVMVVLVEMPFHLAVLSPNAADDVLEVIPEVETWYIGGHSLGGAMASSYAAGHPDEIQGVILLGAYLYGDLSPAHALTLYGSEDQVLDRSKITYTENVIELSGGNHAQFGNYGPQSGDGAAAISAQEQQEQTVQEILSFMNLS